MTEEIYPRNETSLLDWVPNLVRDFREGRLDREYFCINFFIFVADRDLQAPEDTWKPCLDSLPQDLLEMLSQFAETEYRPIGYMVDPGIGGTPSNEQVMRVRLETSAAYRRLHEEIKRRLKGGSSTS